MTNNLAVLLSLNILFLNACDQSNSTSSNNRSQQTGTETETKQPNEAKTNYTLFIQDGTVNISNSPETNNGATQLKVWGYSDIESKPTSKKIIPGTMLLAEQGKKITVAVKNNLKTSHNFSFINLPQNEITVTGSDIISFGNTSTYSITPSQAGIYLYQDSMDNNVNRSLGLYGVMVVRPAASQGNVVWQGGPSFNREVTWVIADLDYKNWNQVAINNGANDGATNVNTTLYKANYFLMNGMNGFQALRDKNTTIEGNIGDVILVRIANAGQYSQSLHFHGDHFKVISRNGKKLSDFDSQDTINIKPNQTAMLLYTIDQLGHYPMHVHTAQMETGAGVYLNGTAAFIIGK